MTINLINSPIRYNLQCFKNRVDHRPEKEKWSRVKRSNQNHVQWFKKNKTKIHIYKNLKNIYLKILNIYTHTHTHGLNRQNRERVMSFPKIGRFNEFWDGFLIRGSINLIKLVLVLIPNWTGRINPIFKTLIIFVLDTYKLIWKLI